MLKEYDPVRCSLEEDFIVVHVDLCPYKLADITKYYGLAIELFLDASASVAVYVKSVVYSIYIVCNNKLLVVKKLWLLDCLKPTVLFASLWLYHRIISFGQKHDQNKNKFVLEGARG